MVAKEAVTLVQPYKFLDSYGFADRHIFFGRERETEILLSDIVVTRLVVLFAKTGTGKTSLINAGVRPRLEELDYATFHIRVEKDPAESLRKALRERNLLPSELEGQSLATQLKYVVIQLDKPVVVFFDQFEEFFIYTFNEDPEKARQFISDIAEVYRNRESGVHIVFSMREEFFVEMDAFRDEIPSIFHNESNLRLRWLDESQARDAIVLPAQEFGTAIEENLVDRLIADLSEEGMIEPAQLQIVCDTLWRKRASSRITLAHYLELGQKKDEANIAQQILNQRLEEEFDKIENEEHLELLEKLLPKLRTKRNTKYIRDFDGLVKTLKTDDSSLGELIKQLEESWLVRTSMRGDLLFIELSHDYLVERVDDLQDRVRVIWPRRILKAAMTDYEARKELMTPEHLEKISENVNNLTFDRVQAEFLFRSALAHGLYIDLWFDRAYKNGVGVWGILKEKIDNRDAEVFDIIDLLAKLQTPDAVELLEKALSQDELAWRAIGALGRIETVSAVELLATALRQDRLASQAQDALEGLRRSRKNPDVASHAQRVLTSFTESKMAYVPAKEKAGAERAAPEKAEQERLAREKAELRRREGGPPMLAFLDAHYKMVIKAITDGRVVPFLGADVNQCGRLPEMEWQHGQSVYLPSGGELAAYLAENFGYPSSEAQDLVHVSQYVAVMMGTGPLYDELHSLFDADYPPTSLHRFFATLPAALRNKGYSRAEDPLRRQLVIVTTNYDDLLERAFQIAGEPFHLVSYVAEGKQRGKFLHWLPDGEVRLIQKPNEYRGLSLDQRSVILKIHGAVNRTAPDAEQDSYVITEDHYIDYLTRTDISNLLPVTLAAKLRRSHILFLGYGLRDWNLRVILHRIWGAQEFTWKSWAIQLNPTPIDKRFWLSRGADILNVSLEEYIAALSERVQALPRAGGAS